MLNYLTPSALEFRNPLSGVTMKRKAPWKDFDGNDIYEGDSLRHPSGERGVVCFWPDENAPSDQWRVFYAEHGAMHSRLCLQIGDKGCGVVAPTGEHNA